MAMRLFHTALASALFLFGPGSARPQAPDNPPAQQQKPSDPSAKPESTLPKTKKIWTNDDLSSRPIQVSGHGSAPTSSFSNGATFLTPADGQIVHPGQNVHFDLSIASGRSSGPVALLSPLGSSNEIRESAPYSFSFTIPRDESQVSGGSRLIGIHPVTAFGKVPGKEEYGLGAIQVDVEESELPTKLSVSGNMMSQYGPPGLRFFDAGSQQWLALIGTFPNGDILDVTNSTNLKLVSGNPKVVSVGEEGMLTSLGPGTTSITATYTLGAQTIQISVPASVTVSNSGLIPTPRSLDFGDQPAGTTSSPLQVTLTNHTRGAITVYKFEIRAAVRESDDCTSAPLPPNGTCTISITFVPFRAGPSGGIIYIPNSHSGQLSLPVSGNGI
jgi:hypothetical protein